MQVSSISHKLITESFKNSFKVVVYSNHKNVEFQKGDNKFEFILETLNKITENAQEMPAFGVSLDKETREAMKKGLWIELVFEREQKYNDMPFESLLIEIESDHSGFNLIRKVNGKFDGRCFYLNLENNMHLLYETFN